jgi:hypothetical protein
MINQNNRYPDKESIPRTLIMLQECLTTIINSKDTAGGNYNMGCVWYRNLVNEEALAHWGAVAPKTKKELLPSNAEQRLILRHCLVSILLAGTKWIHDNQNHRYPDKESYPRTLIILQEYLTRILNSKDTAVGNYIMGTPTKRWFGTHVSYRRAIHLTNP